MEEEEEEHEEQDYEQEEAEEVCNMKKTDHEKREGEEEGSLARSLYSKKTSLYIMYRSFFSLSLSLARVLLSQPSCVGSSFWRDGAALSCLLPPLSEPSSSCTHPSRGP